VTKRTHNDEFDLDDFDHRCLHAEYTSYVYEEIEAEHIIQGR
jgi:hypothetical protein